VGSGLGPVLTGWLSDVLDGRTGGDGLRAALFGMVCTLLPALLAFARAGQGYPAAHRSAMPPGA
jgi:hypothetical protein